MQVFTRNGFLFYFGLTACSLAKWQKSKHKCSVLYKSSIEELNLNLAMNRHFAKLLLNKAYGNCSAPTAF